MKKNRGSGKQRDQHFSSRRSDLKYCKACEVHFIKQYGHDHTGIPRNKMSRLK